MEKQEGQAKPRLVVIGSANRDLVVRTERIPAPGETALGGAFASVPGGKGANQAVAAARLGADVWFVGCVGADTFGAALAEEMRAAGIHTDYLRRDEGEPTGVALIGLDARGQNAIIVAPGANMRLSRQDIDAARSPMANAFAVLIQLEIPLDTVFYAVHMAKELGVRVILNPAPARPDNPVPQALLNQVDLLTPNEHEAAQLLGQAFSPDQDWKTAAEQLRAFGAAAVVITLGEAGCVLSDAAGTRAQEAVRVQAVDTTAAGDCFTASLAVALAEGKSLDEAARLASRAAAISVTRMGAQPSLPDRAEVDAALSATEPA